MLMMLGWPVLGQSLMLVMLAWVARARATLEQLMLMMLAWVARARAELEQLMLMMLAWVARARAKLEQLMSWCSLGWPVLARLGGPRSGKA